MKTHEQDLPNLRKDKSMNLEGQVTAPVIKYNINPDFDVGILYSPNGTGKSKLIQSINSPDENKLEITIIPPERGGNIEINMNTAQQERNKKDSYQQKRKNQVSDYRQRAIAQISIYTNVLADASRSKRLKSEFPYIERKLEDIFPKYFFDIKASDGITVNFIQEDNVVPVNLNGLSTSEADVVSLAVDILCRAIMFKLQSNSSQLLVMVDEPTAYMNVDMTARFAQFILELATSHKIKFLIATNDHEFISAIDFYKNQRKIDLITISDNTTSQKKLELANSDNIVSGFISQGKFLSKKPIFVEGNDDQYVWQRASRIPGGPDIIAVDVGGGREVKPTLDDIELLARAFEKKKILALGLTDGDYPVNYQNEDREFTRGFNLNCHELENLYLTDASLDILGTNWKNVKRLAKRRKILEPLTKTNFSRRQADIKDMITSLSEVIDDQNRDWRDIVSRALVKARDKDQDISDWVGKDVCSFIFITKKDEEE